jgi:hypothetical protein
MLAPIMVDYMEPPTAIGAGGDGGPGDRIPTHRSGGKPARDEGRPIQVEGKI